MGHLKETGFDEQSTAFLGDNCNMSMSVAPISIYHHLSKLMIEKKNGNLIGMDCPKHILIKCLQHGMDIFKFDNQLDVLEIYNVTTTVCNENQIAGRLS
jgi:hypothetical protein